MGNVVTTPERDLLQALKKIRDLRAWAVRKRIDPWALRQALLLTIHIDTAAALKRGISSEGIQAFDGLAMDNARKIRLGEGREVCQGG